VENERNLPAILVLAVFSCLKHVRRPAAAVKAACWQWRPSYTPHNPKTSAGPFATILSITVVRLATSTQTENSRVSRRDCELSGMGGILGIGATPCGYSRTSAPTPAFFRAICGLSSAALASPADYSVCLRSNPLDLRTIFRLQTTGHRDTRLGGSQPTGLWLVRATSRRLAKNSVVTGTETLGGVRPRQAFACGRRQPRQGKVKSRCLHAKIRSSRCANCW
jgi:hypothetical protein